MQHCSAALLVTEIYHVIFAGSRVEMPRVRSTLLRRIQSVHRCYGLPRGRVRHLRRLLLCFGPSYCASAGVAAAILLAFISDAVWLPVCFLR